MNATIDPRVLRGLAKKWPQHFAVLEDFPINSGELVLKFELKGLLFGDIEFYWHEMEHEHLDLIRGRLERIVWERRGEPPDYAFVSHIRPYNAWVGLGIVLSLGESPYNYTEALAIAALRAEGVELGD
jgi:hypothetical protein